MTALILQLAKRRKISRGGKGGKQAISLTEEMVYEMNRSGKIINILYVWEF